MYKLAELPVVEVAIDNTASAINYDRPTYYI